MPKTVRIQFQGAREGQRFALPGGNPLRRWVEAGPGGVTDLSEEEAKICIETYGARPFSGELPVEGPPPNQGDRVRAAVAQAQHIEQNKTTATEELNRIGSMGKKELKREAEKAQ